MNSFYWHKTKALTIALFALLLCSCASEYTTVIRNDTNSDISAELSGGNNDINSGPAYGTLLDSCCKAYKTAGILKISCRVKPGKEVWIGQEYKSFDFNPTLDWNNVIVETADKKKIIINPSTAASLISERNESRSCGDCGPPRIADIISIK